MKLRSGQPLTLLAWTSTLIVVSAVVLLVLFLVFRGGKGLSLSLIFGQGDVLQAVLGRRPVFDGIWPSLVGSIQLVLGASVLALPVGILAGVHLAEYPRRQPSPFLRVAVDVLAGVPSIIMGLFGFGMILFLRRTILPEANTGLLPAMICLALLVLPYLVRTTENALQALPRELRLAGPSLGMTRQESLRRILLPAARPGILAGVLLSVGRVAEDTAVILMTGAVANSGVPGRLTGKFQALPFDIYYLTAEHQGPEDLVRAFATALVLLMLTTGLLTGARLLVRGLDRIEGWTR